MMLAIARFIDFAGQQRLRTAAHDEHYFELLKALYWTMRAARLAGPCVDERGAR